MQIASATMLASIVFTKLIQIFNISNPVTARIKETLIRKTNT